MASVAFELAKTFFFYYSARREGLNQVYGSLTSVAVLLGWLYLSAAIVLIGSLICSIYARLIRLRIVTVADVWSLGTLPMGRWVLHRTGLGARPRTPPAPM